MNCEEFIKRVIDPNNLRPELTNEPKTASFGRLGVRKEVVEIHKKKREAKGGTTDYARDLLSTILWAPELTGGGPIILNPSAAGLQSTLTSNAKIWRFVRDSKEHEKVEGPQFVYLVDIEKINGLQLLSEARSVFRNLQKHDGLEDAIDRIAEEVFISAKKRVIDQRPEEIMVVVSVRDDRDRTREETGSQPTWLLSFYSKLSSDESYEVFRLEERVKFWEPVQCEQHLASLFERQYRHLPTPDWKKAFTTSEERKKAEKLLADFENKGLNEKQISEGMIKLIEEIAGSYGLKKSKRLSTVDLPEDHEIGIGPEEKKKRGKNKHRGLIIRDAEQRLLGYILYCTSDEKEAAELRKRLKEHNRFHNVLLVYPEDGKLELELWQGNEVLEGRLRKGQMQFAGVSRIINLLSRYFVVSRARVRNPEELAKELAYRARYLRQLALEHLETEKPSDQLRELFNRFKEALIHDIDEERFADAYAQTLTYGLLTARWVSKDDVTGRFSRERALKSFPSTSPFLHEFFTTVFNATFEEKLKWLTDDIADLLDRIDMSAVFESAEGDEIKDPVIHFYEPFLGEYDAELRKKMGVYYTPKPVVSFIVRSVHEILQKDFGLEDGLASTITWGEYIKSHPEVKLPKNADANSPFVQILDPATGTATFLVEVVEVIHRTMLAKWNKKGLLNDTIRTEWQKYVEQALLPRVHGFELMMAPYAIAHLKLGLKLIETGVNLTQISRIQIFLTNSLENQKGVLNFIYDAMAEEAKAVEFLKADGIFSVVIGNPPYSGISSNSGKWISDLIEDYKYVEGEHFNERKHWLNDDYVKFIRYGQHFIEKCETGCLAFINPHGFLDNPTFRGMRWNLLKTFDKIYNIDLHGNSKKKEVAIDGSVDVNVFDIQQGVSINFFEKTGKIKANKLGKVFHLDSYGKREIKYEFLLNNSLKSIEINELNPEKPYFFFVPRNKTGQASYEKGFKLPDLFIINSTGMVSARDKFCIDDELQKLMIRINDFANPEINDSEIIEKYGLHDTSTFKLSKSRNNIFKENNLDIYYQKIAYRPFDVRWTFYNNDVVERPLIKVMQHFLNGENIGLAICRQFKTGKSYQHVFVSNKVIESCFVSNRTSEITSVFPIYLYNSDKTLVKIGSTHTRTPNINLKIVKEIADRVGLKFTEEKVASTSSTVPRTFAPIDVFDYIYAVLHCPSYRETYKEFLKADFPRMPYPKYAISFWDLVKYGGELRQLHLFESQSVNDFITTFPIHGNNSVSTTAKFSNGKVFINQEQHFSNVPEETWNFYIGGYQPAQKWLKDRKGRILSDEDIAHYQKIIVALTETDRIMKEIDEVIEKHGGWDKVFVTAADAENDD